MGFLRAGPAFLKKMRRSYIVSVPVIVHGTPAEGRHYIKSATLPISKLGITISEIALVPRLNG